MKKKVLIAALIILAFLIAFWAYMELNYDVRTMVPSSMTEEEIAAEMPEIVISEADLALRDYVLSQPQIQEIVAGLLAEDEDTRKGEALPQGEAEALLADRLPDGWTLLEVFVSSAGVVSVDCMMQENQRLIYSFSADETYPVQKTVGIYGTWHDEDICTAIYSNNLGNIQKDETKHQWFYWIEALQKRRSGS